MTMKTLCRVGVMLMAGAGLAGASFDGIAVSDVNDNGIFAHRIVNGVVTGTTTLLVGEEDGSHSTGTIKTSNPAINTYGTHVAFIRQTATTTHVSVMRVDGANGIVKDVATVPGVQQVEWPQGEWVYYNVGAKLYKVNVQTSQSQLVCTFSMPGEGFDEFPLRDLFTMSADAKRMHFQLIQDGKYKPFEGRYTYELPGNGELTVGVHGPGGGCGPAISPSGLLVGHQTNAAHNERKWNTWGGDETEEKAYNYKQWNSWSPVTELACNLTEEKKIDGVWVTIPWVENLGYGVIETGNRWSRNSDDWMVLQIGWAPEGRSGQNNSNLCIVNFKEFRSLNVTGYGRFVGGDYKEDDFGPYPCAHTAAEARVTHGDFWLQSPLSAVYAPLQEDVRNRDSYKIACIDDGQNCANTVITQVGVRNSGRVVAQSSGLQRQSDGSVLLRGIDAKAGAVSVFALNGVQLWSAVGSGANVVIPAGVLRNRSVVIRVGSQTMLYGATIQN
jgi:hypothetical protein